VKKAATMRLTVFFTFCVAILTLTGCKGAFDPFQRPGDWAATGAANETIAQQVANPADLISGQSESTSNGVAASAAIDKALGANGAGTATGLQTPTTITATAATLSTQ
jgi:hypothetical protein